MSLEIITFKCEPTLAKKLKAEPKTNRRFNSHSEILRTLVDLYLTDFSVKKFIHSALERKYPDIINEEL
jgi:hypothetical protein